MQILLTKIHILYCFSWKVTFSMSKVNFWMFGFIETKRLNIDSFTNGVKFPGEKKKSLLLIRYYK